MEKIFAIGDIHGCLSHLERLISVLDIRSNKDRLVFIGDYIDRGPDSKGVVDFILNLKDTFRKVTCLLGNHEQMLLNYLHGRDVELFLSNGGASTLASYGFQTFRENNSSHVSDCHLQFYHSLLPFCEIDDYVFVHAGLRPGIPLAEQIPDDLLQIRHEFIKSRYDFGRKVVFGHTPFPAPLFEFNKIGIDTGATYGGHLTCLELPSMQIYQV